MLSNIWVNYTLIFSPFEVFEFYLEIGLLFSWVSKGLFKLEFRFQSSILQNFIYKHQDTINTLYANTFFCKNSDSRVLISCHCEEGCTPECAWHVSRTEDYYPFSFLIFWLILLWLFPMLILVLVITLTINVLLLQE